MGNASIQFLGFGLAVAILYNLNRSVIWRQCVLLVASLVLLGSFSRDPLTFIPFAAFVGLGYAGVRLVERAPERWFLPSVSAVIAAFAWLKQYTLIPAPLFLGFSYLTVGLSYILFRILHLIIDRRSEPSEERFTFPRYVAYVINFTTLVSGPIQRYSDFARMAFAPIRAKLSLEDGATALERIVTGYFKTQVAALIFSELHDRALDTVLGPQASKASAGAMLFACYPFFLYCNFSGYIDIVIGLSRLLRITLPENFNRPFSADSFIEFWNRWHITLSQWLKTYVYNPLLMSLMRRYPDPRLEIGWAVLAFFFTFVLIGVWHGQTATFLFFGFLQGLGVSANKLYQMLMIRRMGNKKYRAMAAKPLYVAVSRGLTFTWFAFTLIWFWSKWDQIRAMFSALGPLNFAIDWLVIFAAATLGLALWEALRSSCLRFFDPASSVLPGFLITPRYWKTVHLTVLAVLTIAVALFSGMSAPDIVYKAF